MDLRYPVGKYVKCEVAHRRRSAPRPSRKSRPRRRICATPSPGFRGEQIDTPYRPGGWTVRQVVHHLPDSHMNSYVRVETRAHRKRAHD